ncbi:hypothetical protein CCHL11_08562 [Colletotrichum chlorophyti]|uniref:Uncharacterized protein n=1 Tax=Colletotrichum chlorophyti TaxID=708187 RepID=A0A1Q8RAY9_9PEZI|nr:hypothetical protein CCHL11_08562 [Colletotrichum chlorophyti]
MVVDIMHFDQEVTYSVPNDKPESDRLDMAHTLVTRLIGNKLFLAPLVGGIGHRILDIGTGTEACEMGKVFQNAELRQSVMPEARKDTNAKRTRSWETTRAPSNRASAYPSSLFQSFTWLTLRTRGPLNVRFEADDVEDSWAGHNKYEYIMCRYMAAAIRDWPKLVKNIYEQVFSHGLFTSFHAAEYQDMDIELYSDNGSPTEKHATKEWSKTFVTTLRNIGLDPAPGPQLEGWLRGHGGFNNNFHQKFKAPVGPWPKDKHLKDLGMPNLVQTVDGLEGSRSGCFPGCWGVQRKRSRSSLLACDRSSRAMHFIAGLTCVSLLVAILMERHTCHVVYGQKPLVSDVHEP